MVVEGFGSVRVEFRCGYWCIILDWIIYLDGEVMVCIVWGIMGIIVVVVVLVMLVVVKMLVVVRGLVVVGRLGCGYDGCRLKWFEFYYLIVMLLSVWCLDKFCG